MREKMARFMYGRNGMDDLARGESLFILVLIIFSIFVRNYFLEVLILALMIHMYYRVFSKNVSRRYEENQKYVNLRYNWTVKVNKKKRRFAQMKVYRFYKCPMCQQEVRVPKGHGQIEITCPKCREKFVRKS